MASSEYCAVDPQRAVAYGLFTTAQALAVGWSTADIRRNVCDGRWTRLATGVLATSGRTPQAADATVLAVLRSGPRAIASHTSAARALGWELERGPVEEHVTVPSCQSRTARHPGVQVHRCDVLRVVLSGVLPVTDPVRTALDVAGQLPRGAAVVALDSALRSGAVSLGSLLPALRSRGSWHGAPRAREVLALASPLSGSVPETQFRLLVHDAGLPPPVQQWRIVCDGAVYRADAAWPDRATLAEIDGYAFHSSREAFQRDRERQNALVLAGWHVLRFTPWDVTNRPDAVLAQLRAALT